MRADQVTLVSVLTRFMLTAIALITACGPDPNSLTGGRTARRSSSSSAAGDDVSSDDSSDGSGSTTGSGSSSSSPSKGSGSGTGTGTGAGAATAEQACVDSINKFRAGMGLAPLQRWSAAESCSGTEAQSDGQTSAAHGAFGKCGENAQNECPGWPGPAGTMIGDCLQAMWDEGPGGGHHDNMASRQWTQVSCGFATLPNGSVWAVQNFR